MKISPLSKLPAGRTRSSRAKRSSSTENRKSRIVADAVSHLQGSSPNEVAMGEEGVSGIVLCGYLYKVFSTYLTAPDHCLYRSRVRA